MVLSFENLIVFVLYSLSYFSLYRIYKNNSFSTGILEKIKVYLLLFFVFLMSLLIIDFEDALKYFLLLISISCVLELLLIFTLEKDIFEDEKLNKTLVYIYIISVISFSFLYTILNYSIAFFAILVSIYTILSMSFLTNFIKSKVKNDNILLMYPKFLNLKRSLLSLILLVIFADMMLDNLGFSQEYIQTANLAIFGTAFGEIILAYFLKGIKMEKYSSLGPINNFITNYIVWFFAILFVSFY